VWFEAGLRRVLWTATGTAEGWRLRRFSPSLLDAAAAERRRRPPESPRRSEPGPDWRLDPFWMAFPELGWRPGTSRWRSGSFR
jgi:hypothetical protein